MTVKGWQSTISKNTEELPPYSWLLGYFHSRHDNWDGKTWSLNLHELQLRDLALFAIGDVEGKKVLDVGCGSGEYMLTLAKMGANVSGQDISNDSVCRASSLLAENGFTADLKSSDAAKLQFNDNYFDAVFTADFFEHISYSQKQQVILEIYRVLKPSGVLVIKTPNLSYLKISVFLKRVKAFLSFRSPFFIYIPHTHNNPDNEHHGLTTYKELEKLLLCSMFHFPETIFALLIRKRLPLFVSKFLFRKKLFTEHIIISVRKPAFYGFYCSSAHIVEP